MYKKQAHQSTPSPQICHTWTNTIAKPQTHQTKYYAIQSKQKLVFEYKMMQDFLNQREPNRKLKLKYPVRAQSKIIYDKHLYYISEQDANWNLVIFNLNSQDYRFLALSSLVKDVNSTRVQLASDESGLWLALATKQSATRPFHIFKLVVGESIEIKHHASLDLDWQMIDHLFVIDGVLYVVGNQLSKLLVAYNLYDCQMLPGETISATNFGAAESVIYNPNEPKSLQSTDEEHILSRPIKLH